MPPTVEMWIPNHWTVREFPGLGYFKVIDSLLKKTQWLFFFFLVNYCVEITKVSHRYKITPSSIIFSKDGEDTKAKEVLIQYCTSQSKSRYKTIQCQVY